jgi:hypothetical protein
MADDTRNDKAVGHKVGHEYESPDPRNTICCLRALIALRAQRIGPKLESSLTSAHHPSRRPLPRIYIGITPTDAARLV